MRLQRQLKQLFLVDIGTGKQLSEIKMQGSPRQICIAAAAPCNQIKFIHVHGSTLTSSSILDVKHSILGIARHDDNIVISTDAPTGVEMITRDGTVVQRINNEKAGRKVFEKPLFLTTTSDGSIFVSDWETNTIAKFDLCLNIQQIFLDPMIKHPMGIIAKGQNQILVCSRNNDSIVLMRTTTNDFQTDERESPQEA